MNATMTFIDNKTSNDSNASSVALTGSILITALVMVAAVRWAASDAGYGSLLASLGIAAGSSLLLIAALWVLPGAEQPRPHSPTPAQPQTV